MARLNIATRAYLNNYKMSLKWLWQVFMGLALFKTAQEQLNDILENNELLSSGCFYDVFKDYNVIIWISFILFFVRIFLGNSRYIDLTYDEHFNTRSGREEVRKFVVGKRAEMLFALIIHGYLFYVVAYSSTLGVDKYVQSFFSYIFIDAIWLSREYKDNRDSIRNKGVDIINMRRYDPLKKWAINNILCVLAAFFVCVSSFTVAKDLLVGITILNSVLDFRFTWRYYFPVLPIQEGDACP